TAAICPSLPPSGTPSSPPPVFLGPDPSPGTSGLRHQHTSGWPAGIPCRPPCSATACLPVHPSAPPPGATFTGPPWPPMGVPLTPPQLGGPVSRSISASPWKPGPEATIRKGNTVAGTTQITHYTGQGGPLDEWGRR